MLEIMTPRERLMSMLVAGGNRGVGAGLPSDGNL